MEQFVLVNLGCRSWLLEPTKANEAMALIDVPLEEAKANLLPTTTLHPSAVVIPMIAAADLLSVYWLTFVDRGCSLILAVVTLIFVMLFGLLAVCGTYSRNIEPDRATTRSFVEFLNGDVDIETGRIPGRAALLQMAAMPIMVAVGGTIMCAAAAWTPRPNALTAQSAATIQISPASLGAPAGIMRAPAQWPD
jgi:hypothetical protein